MSDFGSFKAEIRYYRSMTANDSGSAKAALNSRTATERPRGYQPGRRRSLPDAVKRPGVSAEWLLKIMPRIADVKVRHFGFHEKDRALAWLENGR